jgi:hypothetical protein
MDASRKRRTRDGARQRWYATWRSSRFARHFGVVAKSLPLVDSLAENSGQLDQRRRLSLRARVSPC